jgi:carboxyl-terminal processing protease
MKKIFYLIIVLSAGLISSCKKEKKTPPVTTPPPTALNLMQDSIYYYEKEDYLWFDAIPSYATFNPRSFKGADEITALTNELNAISQLKINPTTNLPYEYYAPAPGEAKYSFVDDGTETSSLNGINGDFGFDIQYNQVNDLRIEFVYPGSPADLAGIKRAYEITSINNNSNISYDGPGFGSSTNINFVSNAVYNSSSITMKLLKPDGSTISVSLSTASYTVNPVLKDTVFDEGNGNKLGYIVFNSFTTLSNAQPQLDKVFNYFIANGVTDVAVDLRYNGGGDGSTAEYLDDLIVPASKTGTLMYTQYFNANLQNNIFPLLKKKYAINNGDFLPQNNRTLFSKALTLNVNRAFFIVTNQTASSSELTINNLRPELNVQLVGDTTYGKPVGEIPIPIQNYILYSPQLYVENSANQGDYYAGMAPGSAAFPGNHDYDDLTKDFGDPTEGLLSEVLSYVKTGIYKVKTPVIQSLQSKRTFIKPKSLNTIKPKLRAMVLKSKLKFKN